MSIALTDLYGKKLALLVWYTSADAEPRAAVVSGVAFMHNGKLSLHRGNILPPLAVPLHLVWQARPVPTDLQNILQHADYCIQGTVKELGIAS
jgi:hypothetical protein